MWWCATAWRPNVSAIEASARALMALAERPAHAALTASLALRLRSLVKLSASGELTEPDERSARALVYAALLRTQKLGVSPATGDVLSARLAALRDTTGGYGSSGATLAAVEAILASQLEGHGTSRVHAVVQGGAASLPIDVSVDVPPEGSVRVPLSAGALRVGVASVGPGVLARLEVPVLRLWSRPPPSQDSPVKVEIVWPADARAGKVGTLRLLLRQSLGRDATVDVRVPLPPGVTLAAPVGEEGMVTGTVRQIQGVLALRWPVDQAETVVELPVRFGLAGHLQTPEASARISRESYAPAWAPASAIEVR